PGRPQRFDVEQVSEVVAEARGRRPVIPRPERRLGNRHDTRAGHILVIIRRPAHAVNVGVDEFHGWEAINAVWKFLNVTHRSTSWVPRAVLRPCPVFEPTARVEYDPWHPEELAHGVNRQWRMALLTYRSTASAK